MGSKSHIFPRGFTLRTEHVVATVECYHLQVILPPSNFHRGKLSQFGGKCHEAFIPTGGDEDTTLERLMGFFIDECSHAHPAACCKLEQAARFDDCCHTKIQEENNFGFTGGGGYLPHEMGVGGVLIYYVSLMPMHQIFQKIQKKF